MITNTGKSILAKYLIGQTGDYASYIAIGCGSKPLATDTNLLTYDFSEKKNLDFEMFRVPITSRGYVVEDGISKVVFTGELPSPERYEISEVGIYSAGSNPAAGLSDSKILYAFSQNEAWEYHNQTSSIAIPSIYSPLDGDYLDNGIHGEVLGDPVYGNPVFQTNADNRIFNDSTRLNRYERARFLNNIVMMPGNDSTLNITSGHLVPAIGSNHIHFTGPTLNLNRNAPDDEIRLAFSIINKNVSSGNPDSVRILLEFASTDVLNDPTAQFARFELVLENGTGPGQQDFSTNRYVVAKKQLQELYKSSGFTWSTVDVVKVFVSVIKDNTPSEDFYIALDAIRLENVSTTNPLYGLVGYSVIKNDNSRTIVKASNTTNFVEFRFAMDVQ